LPPGLAGRAWANVLTGERWSPADSGDGACLALDWLFRYLPVALLADGRAALAEEENRHERQ